MLDLFLPVETYGPEIIRHRQRLAQAVCLEYNTRSALWKLLDLWNALRSVTLTFDVGPFYWWLKGNTKEALKFVLLFVLPACSHFFFCLRHSIFTCIIYWLTFHAPYHARMLQPYISLHIPVLCTASSHTVYCCTLYRPRNAPVLC